MLNLANIEAHKKFVNFVEHIDTSEAILIESMKRQEVSLLSTMFTPRISHNQMFASQNLNSLQLRDSLSACHCSQMVPLEQCKKTTSVDVEFRNAPILDVKPQVIHLTQLEITG